MDILDKVIEHPVPENYYTLKEKAISVVKAKQLMNALKRSASNPQRFGPPPSTWQRPRNFPPSGPPPRFPQYNSTNTPRWMNNIPVPIDLSRGQAPYNRGGTMGRGRGQWHNTQGNIAQADRPPQPCTKGPCFKCGKQGHFTRECCSHTQINYTNYMDKPDNMVGMQPPLAPVNILDNVLSMFDSLPNDQKDKLIQKYKGGSQDFPDV
jgi:hypothetical protein